MLKINRKVFSFKCFLLVVIVNVGCTEKTTPEKGPTDKIEGKFKLKEDDGRIGKSKGFFGKSVTSEEISLGENKLEQVSTKQTTLDKIKALQEIKQPEVIKLEKNKPEEVDPAKIKPQEITAQEEVEESEEIKALQPAIETKEEPTFERKFNNLASYKAPEDFSKYNTANKEDFLKHADEYLKQSKILNGESKKFIEGLDKYFQENRHLIPGLILLPAFVQGYYEECKNKENTYLSQIKVRIAKDIQDLSKKESLYDFFEMYNYDCLFQKFLGQITDFSKVAQELYTKESFNIDQNILKNKDVMDLHEALDSIEEGEMVATLTGLIMINFNTLFKKRRSDTNALEEERNNNMSKMEDDLSFLNPIKTPKDNINRNLKAYINSVNKVEGFIQYLDDESIIQPSTLDLTYRINYDDISIDEENRINLHINGYLVTEIGKEVLAKDKDHAFMVDFLKNEGTDIVKKTKLHLHSYYNKLIKFARNKELRNIDLNLLGINYINNPDFFRAFPEGKPETNRKFDFHNFLKKLDWKTMDDVKSFPVKEFGDTSLINYSILNNLGSDDNRALRGQFEIIKKNPKDNRAIGSLVGLLVGDALGAPVEFLDAQNIVDDKLRFSKTKKIYVGGTCDNFGLKTGQYTDDSSMGLCLLDSLLYAAHESKDYDGKDLRRRFYCWWNYGYNNAFRYDAERSNNGHSIGLGGNISKSLNDLSGKGYDKITDEYNNDTQDSGNGSIMRFAPVAIRFSNDISKCLEVSAKQSKSTHPGVVAADCSKLLGFILSKAIERDSDDKKSIKDFLDKVTKEFLAKYEKSICNEVRKLVRTNEKENSLELVWNWNSKKLDVEKTLANRGTSYNGYPVSKGYFGSYAPDGLAIALHSCYTTDNFEDAIIKCISFLGDADTTGAIAGQIAGAFYGYDAIPKWYIEQKDKWDKGETELKATLLVGVNMQNK